MLTKKQKQASLTVQGLTPLHDLREFKKALAAFFGILCQHFQKRTGGISCALVERMV